MFKLIFMMLNLFPTFSFFTLISGSTPFGIFLLPFFNLKLRANDLLFLSGLIFLLIISSFKIFSLLELVKLSLGPLIYIVIKEMDLPFLVQKFMPLFLVILVVLVLDSMSSGQITGSRGITFLTHEPSHSGRAFGTLVFLIALVKPDKILKLILISCIFLIFNKSGLFVLMLIFFIIFFLLSKFNFKLIFLSVTLVFAGFWLFPEFSNSRFMVVIVNMFSATTWDGSNYLSIINVVGGPRFVLSFAAFFESGILGYGVGSSDLVFTEIVKNSGNIFNPHSIEFISREVKITSGSYLSQVSFEGGMITLIFISIILFKNIKKHLFLIGVFGYLQLLLLSSTTMITPWVFLAFASNKFLQSNLIKKF